MKIETRLSNITVCARLVAYALTILISACNSPSIATSKPVFTSTIIPSVTPHPTFDPQTYHATRRAVATLETEMKQAAKEMAITLAGDQAVRCEHALGASLEFPLQVNECVIETFEAKQPFLIYNVHSRIDTVDYYWIVGTAQGDVYLIVNTYNDMFASVSSPSPRQCLEPRIIYFDDTPILDCKL